MTSSVIVACCQLAPRLGDLEYNRRLTEAAIRSAAAQGANIVVLPELVQSGYVFNDVDEALASAETEDGPTLQGWTELAKALDIVVVAGFCERLDEQTVANSAVLIDPLGRRAIYRKVHLWDREKLYFTAGQQPPLVVDTRFGRVALMICYDLEMPEWVRLAALAGADLLCAPVNWPLAPRPEGERPGEVVRVQANASVNRLFIAACDRCGEERGVNWVGGTVIVDADGYPVAGPLPGDHEHTLFAQLDLVQARNKWISERNHVHKDRVAHLYRAGVMLDE